jgi:hypothetical protein
MAKLATGLVRLALKPTASDTIRLSAAISQTSEVSMFRERGVCSFLSKWSTFFSTFVHLLNREFVRALLGCDIGLQRLYIMLEGDWKACALTEFTARLQTVYVCVYLPSRATFKCLTICQPSVVLGQSRHHGQGW